MCGHLHDADQQLGSAFESGPLFVVTAKRKSLLKVEKTFGLQTWSQRVGESGEQNRHS